MSAPVPRTAYAERGVVRPWVQVVPPVIRVFAYCNYRAGQTLVILNRSRVVVRDHYGILPVSEKVDRRFLGLGYKLFCFSFALRFLLLREEVRSAGINAVLELLSLGR